MKNEIYAVSKIFGETGEYISGQHFFDTYHEAWEAAEIAVKKLNKESKYNAVWIELCEWNETHQEYQPQELIEEFKIQ